MKKILITGVLAVGLSACVTTEQAEDLTVISANAYIANEAVDVAQEVVGGFSVNQGTIAELEQLQADISASLKNGTIAFNVNDLYERGVAIYAVLYAEAIDRQDELSAIQLNILQMLNTTLISLSNNIVEFQENSDNAKLIGTVSSVGEVLSTAQTILSLYSVVK